MKIETFEQLDSITEASKKIKIIKKLLNETENVFCSYHLKYIDYWKVQGGARTHLQNKLNILTLNL